MYSLHTAIDVLLPLCPPACLCLAQVSPGGSQSPSATERRQTVNLKLAGTSFQRITAYRDFLVKEGLQRERHAPEHLCQEQRLCALIEHCSKSQWLCPTDVHRTRLSS